MVEGFGRSEAAKAAWVQRRLGVDLTGSGKRATLERGSGGSATSPNAKNVHYMLGRIDPSDEAAKEALIRKFCKMYARSEVENMLVITKDGEVHYLTSNEKMGLNTDAVEGKLAGSYNIHTHPEDVTQFSFSTDVDIPCFFEDGSAVMEAVDYKYRYRFKRPDGVTWEQWEAVRYKVSVDIKDRPDQYGLTESNYEENVQHTLVRETCRRLGLNCYERWQW